MAVWRRRNIGTIALTLSMTVGASEIMSAEEQGPSFIKEIVPVLTKAGCNAGAGGC
jgi:hypothetical protein